MWRAREGRGGPWRAVESLGGSGKVVKGQGGPWRVIECQGGSWRIREGHGQGGGSDKVENSVYENYLPKVEGSDGWKRRVYDPELQSATYPGLKDRS